MESILIFGTGSVAYNLLMQLDKKKVNILGFINSNASIDCFYGYNVIRPESIHQYKFDYIVIGSGYYKKIYPILREMGIPDEKIVTMIFDDIEMHEEFNKHINIYIDQKLHRDKMKKWFIEGSEYSKFYIATIWKNNEMLSDIRKDFVREETTYLMAKEIKRKNLEGSIAELGVYRGDFTMVLNAIFDDRKIYLYDTFDGFSGTDLKNDMSVENKQNELLKFRDTSAQIVLSRIPNPDLAEVVQGLFPESFMQYDEKFCFVSIDFNLYDPVKSAMDIFYRRLVPGGYMLISDYGAPYYDGTRKAIQDWCDKNDKVFLPVADLYESVVIQK